MTTDHRKRPRRRGATLDEAILSATIAELDETGYAKLTMEGVAERARTGKASVYRRWPSRMELAMAAVYSVMPDPSDPPDTGSLRGDLLALLRTMAELLDGPAGEAMRGLLGDALRDPDRTHQLRRISQGSGRKAMTELARRAAERGEIDAEAITTTRIDAGQSMLRQHFLFNGPPIPDELIVAIVDEVIIPLLSRPAAA